MKHLIIAVPVLIFGPWVLAVLFHLCTFLPYTVTNDVVQTLINYSPINIILDAFHSQQQRNMYMSLVG